MKMRGQADRYSPTIGDRARAVRVVYAAIREGSIRPPERGARIRCTEWLHADSSDAWLSIQVASVLDDEYTPIGCVMMGTPAPDGGVVRLVMGCRPF